MTSSRAFASVGFTSGIRATVGRISTESPTPSENVFAQGRTWKEAGRPFASVRAQGWSSGGLMRLDVAANSGRLWIETVGTRYNAACDVMLRENIPSKFVVKSREKSFWPS